MNLQKKLFIKFLFLLWPQLLLAKGGSMDSGGGHPVDVKFIKARKEIIKILDSISYEKIKKLPLENTYKNWLKENRNLAKLQFYSRKVILSFQDEACKDQNIDRGACFYKKNLDTPKIIVSRKMNKSTSFDSAIALLIHELGHCVGEKDHYFLGHFGEALAKYGKKEKKEIELYEETKEKNKWFGNKTKSNSFSSLSVGPKWSNNLDAGGFLYHVNFSKLSEVSSSTVLKFVIDGAVDNTNSGNFWGSLGYGLNYMFLEKNTSPYIGFDIGGGYTQSKKYNETLGFAGGIQIGFTFFRLSDTQLYIETNYRSLLKNNPAGLPSIWGFQMGLNF